MFVKSISGKLHEDAWRGHMVVENIEGIPYAIFHHKELWLNKGVPSSIRECSRQDPKRSYATAIRFDAMEAYLLSLIEKLNSNDRRFSQVGWLNLLAGKIWHRLSRVGRSGRLK